MVWISVVLTEKVYKKYLKQFRDTKKVFLAYEDLLIGRRTPKQAESKAFKDLRKKLNVEIGVKRDIKKIINYIKKRIKKTRVKKPKGLTGLYFRGL